MSAAAIAESEAISYVDTLTGSGNWIAPFTGFLDAVECLGGGGGGGKGNVTAKGAGGAGGNAARTPNYFVTKGQSYAYSVGIAGAGQGTSTLALVGGDTSFDSGAVLAKGGAAASGPNIPGLGTTTGSVGTTKQAGGNGTTGATGGAGGTGASIGSIVGGAGAPATGAGVAGSAGSPPGGGGSSGGSSAALLGGSGAVGTLKLLYKM